jgi:hypothetical protein
MQVFAVIRLRGSRLEVLVGVPASVPGVPASDLEGLTTGFARLGLEEGARGSWSGPLELLEPVCSLLDRLGFVWGVYDPDDARTFGERLFAECPPEIAPRVYQALRSTFEESSAELHLAVLDAAWSAFDGTNVQGRSRTGEVPRASGSAMG